MKKVMIVEDSALMVAVITNFIQKDGTKEVEIISAKNGEEAISMYETEFPDLVFMDIKMPVMDGITALEKIRSKHSDAKVIFNGDGADELTGGYLYLHNAPNKLLFDYEVKSLLQNIHFFDVLRSDRCISSCGLEPRTPFLDKTFVNIYLSIPLVYRNQKDIEKKLLRDSFVEFLPQEILYRKKEAFSDGVSSNDRSWYQVINEKLESVEIPNINHKNYLKPKTKEIINKHHFLY